MGLCRFEWSKYFRAAALHGLYLESAISYILQLISYLEEILRI